MEFQLSFSTIVATNFSVIVATSLSVIELMGAFVVSDFIPYLKCFDMGGYIKEMKKMAIDLDNIFGGWLQEHKTIKSFTQQHESNQLGFIDVLISILQGVSKEEFRDFDDDTIIKSACQVNSNSIISLFLDLSFFSAFCL